MTDKRIIEIQEFLKEGNVTAQGLAAASGLHKNTLIGIKKADWKPSENTLRLLLPSVRRFKRLISKAN